MVSRQNLTGRGTAGGILGRAYKGPSGPGNVTPPGMENRARRRGGKIMESQDSAAALSSGAQNPATKPRRGRGIFDQAKSAIEQRRTQIEADRAAKYPTTSPGVGETAYRPGFTDKDAARIAKDQRRRLSKPERKAARRQEIFDKIQSKYGKKKGGGFLGGIAEQIQAQRDAQAPPQVDTTQIGIRESLGDMYVEPGTRPALGGPAAPGANEPTAPAVAGGTTGAPRRRGSAASRSRRNIR